MLKEHFRCVEPIIRFSMQFYSESIIPLRIPKASERLDPPLIDVHVTYGLKDRRQINHAEAEAIVEEIVKLTDSPEYDDRTIGVVSLIGAKQAQHIQALLLGRIGEEKFLKHQIVCGDPATFQGKERHIMFVSMVECPRTKSAKTALLYEQRFNVALSRARDRMYLYRSVTEETLKPNDLKAKVIQHLNNPMTDTLSECDDLVALCESDFERDVCRRLMKDGYRVKPQVKVGPYSIDLVIEGSEDRRLAVELDGDQYHTPDRWAIDYLRQRDLERVGWRFWRCWGSSFIMAPDECIKDLVETLSSMGIEPIGYDTRSNGIYTEHRVLERPIVMDEDYEEDMTFKEEPAEDHVHVMDETIPLDSNQYTGLAQADEAFRVEFGDRVLIAYNDEPGLRHTIEIGSSSHNPDMKIIDKNMPMAEALIDAEIHEEVEIPAGGQTRIVTIMGIEKGEMALSIKTNDTRTEPKY
jgi:very-short-patch-repair endonuclease